jgi:hypothetical protein
MRSSLRKVRVTDPNKAVFLSHASQDAQAAEQLGNSLRSAGIEIWFDQSERRGGDAWDALTRRQGKGCYLFVPVISANTRSREEGEVSAARCARHSSSSGTQRAPRREHTN